MKAFTIWNLFNARCIVSIKSLTLLKMNHPSIFLAFIVYKIDIYNNLNGCRPQSILPIWKEICV